MTRFHTSVSNIDFCHVKSLHDCLDKFSNSTFLYKFSPPHTFPNLYVFEKKKHWFKTLFLKNAILLLEPLKKVRKITIWKTHIFSKFILLTFPTYLSNPFSRLNNKKGPILESYYDGYPYNHLPKWKPNLNL